MSKKKTTQAKAKALPDKQSGKSLQILASEGRKLSKEQQTFNKLTEWIEKLTRDIAKEEKKLDTILHAYGKIIPPAANELAENQIKLAQVLDSITEKLKFSSKQKDKVGELIMWLLTDAFSTLQPDDTTKAIYDKWSDTTYDEELKEEKEMMKKMFSSTFREKFGVDIDLSDIGDDPESFHRLRERAAEEIRQKEAEQSNKKKSKAQILKEEREKATEAEKLKSIRSVYHSLAKMLHPDTASNEDEKVMKEELMKKITIAYNDKDLSTLLKLELEFVASEKHDVQKLAKEKLKLYIMALEDQIRTLNQERVMQRDHPRYMPISNYVHATEKVAVKMLKEEENYIKTKTWSVNRSIKKLQAQPASKKEVNAVIKDLDLEMDMENMFGNGDFFGNETIIFDL